MFEGYRKATFTDYKNEVLNTYRRDGIKIGLEDPRPKKLREYSLYVYANRFSKEDEQTLKLFFDQDNKYNDLEKAIKSIELDKIKPLIRFMNGATKETEDKNVKLLAWLINFESYDAWRKNKQDMGKAPVESELIRQEVEHSGTFAEIEKDKNTSSAEDKNKDDEQELAEVEKRPLPISQLEETNKPSPPKPAYKQWVLYTVITSVTAIGIYFALHRNPGCMFWSGDHYQPVSCKEKIQDVTIIALDESKVDRFRKITRPDTLTERALGKVWYVKMTIDSLEFYTAGGFHPIYTSKKLKPLTDYILERHIQYKQPADSLGK
ncbi:hypothetical protein RYH73_11485 [Olivibacter sp. CPCC 100613]|uniref:hypothetical protein n=1 Tax=Olivibacter sp. CPCC 100613 TaxID=3079931 RepID=UPI002FFCE9AE